jgi:hypothetical protein
MQELHELHWKATNLILRYVHGTIIFGIHYETYSTLDLIRFTDFDWVSDSTDHRSTYIYSPSLGSRPICWLRKKKSSIGIYSVEVDYRGVVNITMQAMSLQNFLTELGIQFHQSIVIWCDNQSNMNFYRDPFQRHQTKHIDIHMHYIRDLVHEGIIDL